LHGIHIPDNDITIPFHMNGAISCISGNRLPTQKELDKCDWIYMTSRKKPWDPYDNDWMQRKAQAVRAAERNEPYSFEYPTHVEHATYDHHGCRVAYINGRRISTASTTN
jgi:hypothetical protein